MEPLETELERARRLDVGSIADAIQSIGFECTRCGACCRGHGDDHTATVFPDEVRDLQAATGYDWRDVARPVPFGLDDDGGETFEWALRTDGCGDCAFYEPFDGGAENPTDVERAGTPTDSEPIRESTDRGGAPGAAGEDRPPKVGKDGPPDAPDGRCTVYGDRPLVCRTYPFSLALGGTGRPMGGVVEEAGAVRAHECEGLGRAIDRDDAEALARTLKERAVRELEEAVAIRDGYEPADPGPGEVVVHDSEGAKRPDGRPYED